jgi:RNA polymerase sigma-70 factor (ECF subfamily)
MLERLRAGDHSAWDEVYAHTGTRLETLASKMLRGFPEVRRWEQTADVLQNATLRLLRALRAVQPSSVGDFFALAGVQIRRELLDLKRHYCGPRGMASRRVTPLGVSDSPDFALQKADTAPTWDELEEWGEFHRQIDGLPSQEREVVDLHFYQGLSKLETAEVLNVDVRTVQRRWNAALDRLCSLRKRD